MSKISSDIVIVGSGPAGLMAAISAKQADPAVEVTVIDKAGVQQHKIGEALLTGTIMTMADAGLIDKISKVPFQRKRGAAYVWGETKDTWHVHYSPLQDRSLYPEEYTLEDGSRQAIHVPRHVFDDVLRRSAIEAGVHFINGKASFELAGEGDSLHVSRGVVDGANIYAGHWIDASGQSAILARAANMRIPVLSSRVARYAYIDDINWALAEERGFSRHYTNIISTENGWMWVIHIGSAAQHYEHNQSAHYRTEDGVTSIGFVTKPEVAAKLTPDNVRELFPELAWFGLDKIKPMDVYGNTMCGWHVQPDYSWRSTRINGANWSLVGDSAMFIDPILSQGVSLACHYGFMRGKAAVAMLDGMTHAQAQVSQHYSNEGAVLLEVVSEWYSNNRAVNNWKMKTVDIARNNHGKDMDERSAFQWITNLENIRNEYDPYNCDQNNIIKTNLGLI